LCCWGSKSAFPALRGFFGNDIYAGLVGSFSTDPILLNIKYLKTHTDEHPVSLAVKKRLSEL